MGSSFQIQKVSVPVTPDKGGTGVTTLTDKGVIVGAGTGNVTSVAPGASGNYLKSDGTNWTSSSNVTPGDATISYPKLSSTLTGIVAISASNVDWSAGGIYTKTLSANTTLTFSNYQLDKMIVLQISGDYTLALPTTVNIISGSYDGKVMNYITLHCTKEIATEEVWAMINQQVTSVGYGYFGGGVSSTYVATADRIVFSTGVTSANTVSNLSIARFASAGLSDGSINGYFAGGFTSAYVATADRIVFSTGVTSANTVSNLSTVRGYIAGFSDSSVNGYFAGGNSGSTVATADRIVLSTGATSANTVSNLSQARNSLAGISDASTFGYFAGGSTGTSVDTADRIVFATGVTSVNTASKLSAARSSLAGISDGTTYGYFAGGLTNFTYFVTVDRIVFATGVTSANTVSDLSQAKANLTGLSDGFINGYFAGGSTGVYVDTADLIVFSTGATSANTASNLSTARGYGSGVSDCAV